MSESSAIYWPKIPPMYVGFVSKIARMLDGYRVGYIPVPRVWGEGYELLHVVVEAPEEMAQRFREHASVEPAHSLQEIALDLLGRPELFQRAHIMPEAAGAMGVVLIPERLPDDGVRLWLRELMWELAEHRRGVEGQSDELPPYRYFDGGNGCFVDL